MKKEEKNIEETWFHNKWRPALAWAYFAIIIFDFILGPIMFTVFAAKTGNALIKWEPLTLVAGGTFHISMGAILGVTSWTRGQEKIQRIKKQKEFDDFSDNPPIPPQ